MTETIEETNQYESTEYMQEFDDFVLEPDDFSEELILDDTGERVINILPIKNRILFNYTLNMKALTRQEYVLRLVTVMENVEEAIIPIFISFKEVLKRFAYGTARLNEVQLAFDNCKSYIIEDGELNFDLTKEEDWYKMSFAISNAVAETMVQPILSTLKSDIEEISNLESPDEETLEYYEQCKKIITTPAEVIGFQILSNIILLTVENRLEELDRLRKKN